MACRARRHGRTRRYRRAHKVRRYRKRTRAARRRPRRRTMRGGWAPLSTGGWRSQEAGPVGCPWKAKPGTWPGVFASAGGDTHGTTVSNHFGLSPSGVGPAAPPESTRNRRQPRAAPLLGGSRCRRRRSRKRRGRRSRRSRGGGHLRPFLPQPITNTMWQAGAAMTGLGNAWSGKVTPPSAYPSVMRQPIDKDYTYIGMKPIDIKQIHLDAADAAARL